jgi:hypothetical protein
MDGRKGEARAYQRHSDIHTLLLFKLLAAISLNVERQMLNDEEGVLSFVIV